MLERVQRHVKIPSASVAIVILRFEIPIYAIIGHLHRAVIIGRARARSVGTFSSRLVESPGAEWVGELKNRYESESLSRSTLLFLLHVPRPLLTCHLVHSCCLRRAVP